MPQPTGCAAQHAGECAPLGRHDVIEHRLALDLMQSVSISAAQRSAKRSRGRSVPRLYETLILTLAAVLRTADISASAKIDANDPIRTPATPPALDSNCWLRFTGGLRRGSTRAI